MKRSSIFYRQLVRGVGAAAVALTMALPGINAAEPASTQAPQMRLKEFLWREVQNKEGKTLGSVSDVLVEMPSGKIVFVAVVPSGFYQRPKTLPPGAVLVPSDPTAPLQVDITQDRWIDAPWIDWNPRFVVKNEGDGARIYAYYQQRWSEPDPTPAAGVEVVASKKDRPPPLQYVSLNDLLLERVTTPAWEQAGFVTDILLDWSVQRATHALVSPQFTPLARPDQKWFAIPMPLFVPPGEEDSITVNSSVQAFQRAPDFPQDGSGSTDVAQIYRYPAVLP
jgi:sporulation protein YlmC with PRC-barrel domain